MLYIKIDAILVLITVISIITRSYRLDYPKSVVFDELHYIKFASLYMKRIFFFNFQPPLGTQLISIIAYLFNFSGDLIYNQIGDSYKDDVPIIALRILPCICGSLIAPLIYSIAIELGLRQTTAIFAAIAVILENSLLTQSRFILMDSLMICFMQLSLLSSLKFNKTEPLTFKWILLLNATMFFATLSSLVKYSGLYSFLFVLIILSISMWNNIGHAKYSSRQLWNHSLHHIVAIILFPIFIYFSLYYSHLRWLNQAGPHDNIMTSAFQASLENGLASITKGQPLEIVHGSQITVRNTHGRGCWLHSHDHLYPIKYTDGRGSSHQQQVTCYSFKDVNNWWIVKRPHVDDLVVSEPRDKIKNGDIIQLVHGLTGRLLNSHDVASAMSPHSQEVSCYVDHNISMTAQDNWRIELLNWQETNNQWHTINSRFKLIHLNSSLALRFSGRQLPDWGFHQHEVTTDRDLKHEDAIWNVEEHRFTKSSDQKEREHDLGQADFIPLEPTYLSFWDKFLEIHYKMVTHQQDGVKDHLYACENPLDWIFLNKGTAYWVDPTGNSNRQIFFLGNVYLWHIGNISMATMFFIWIMYILRRRRLIFDLDDNEWQKFCTIGTVTILGYLVHLMPYFLYESTLFLHNYLPALTFKILVVAALVDNLYRFFPAYVMIGIMVSLVSLLFSCFIKFLPITYGIADLTGGELVELKWKQTWQLITIVQ